MNEIQKLMMFRDVCYGEMQEYILSVNICDFYIPSLVNYAILYYIIKYRQGFIDGFKLEKMIDIIMGYDFAYHDGLIDVYSLYRHLKGVIGEKTLKVHKDDCDKFGFIDSESN